MKQEINDKIYTLLFGSLSIKEFENWIYESNELKLHLSDDIYLNLISLDYRKDSVKYEVEKILKECLDYGAFETQKMIMLLQESLKRTKKLSTNLRKFYYLYCHGYYFLQDLGLGYGLMCEVPSGYFTECWEELKEKEKSKIINSFYPELELDLERALAWIEEKKIILTGEKDEIDHWKFIDNRNKEEKKSSMWVEIERNPEDGSSVSKNILWENKSKKWWAFWKGKWKNPT